MPVLKKNSSNSTMTTSSVRRKRQRDERLTSWLRWNKAHADLAAKREQQTAAHQRVAGSNSAGSGYNRQFIQRFGNVQQQMRTPARRVVGK